jgi:hypothetical protein
VVQELIKLEVAREREQSMEIHYHAEEQGCVIEVTVTKEIFTIASSSSKES